MSRSLISPPPLKNSGYGAGATAAIPIPTISDGPTPIKLSPAQEIHVEALIKILMGSACALDMSIMGTGKTFTASALAQRMGFYGVIVICQASIEARWTRMKTLHGVPIITVISYTSLGTKVGKQPKHGLLTRIEGDTVRFEATEKLRAYIRAGILLVVDEFQNIKNKSVQHNACKEVITSITFEPDRSRALLLSGSPMDKPEHAVHLMQSIGIIRHYHLSIFHELEARLELRGAQELIDYCLAINPTGTDIILSKQIISTERVKPLCYELFRDVIRPHITSAMPPIVHTHDVHVRNHYYILPEEESVQLADAIGGLKKAVHFNSDTNTLDNSPSIWTALTGALSRVESAKIPTFYREARKILDGNPKAKVVLCLNYTSTIDTLAYLLEDYSPMVLNGEVNKKARDISIQLFQRPTLEKRLIIGNLKVCSTGIDLDDKEGTFPRHCFASPNFSVIDIYQLVHRFKRMDTQSEANVGFVYGKVGFDETSILSALARKSVVMKDLLVEQVKGGVVFPSDYKKHLENDDGSVSILESTKIPEKPTKHSSKASVSTAVPVAVAAVLASVASGSGAYAGPTAHAGSGASPGVSIGADGYNEDDLADAIAASLIEQ
jgi:hypothetical protein